MRVREDSFYGCRDPVKRLASLRVRSKKRGGREFFFQEAVIHSYSRAVPAMSFRVEAERLQGR